MKVYNSQGIVCPSHLCPECWEHDLGVPLKYIGKNSLTLTIEYLCPECGEVEHKEVS